ncbi:hypothetical protein [Chitinophaga cymbidii]|uniref:Major capsid protein n=1 Tax=Chitinophaga cymbidii TaxID=1096750 RepID=A0A512RIP6_9BACT|nr:hypothetical protein [Chitinophaga cymbidii]GEP95568.1 hypothetical protein CCY01nite_18280 [Chitinophaga cymbidii]
MALDLDALENYTQQNAEDLVVGSLFEAKTQRIIKSEGVVETGIKSARTVNRLETDVIFQDDDDCGFTPSGTTKISQRVLEVGPIKVNEALCPKKLNRVYLQHEVKQGSADDEIPFEEEYSEQKMLGIAAANEVAIWQGDKDGVDANLNKYDGFIKILAAGDVSGSVIHANVAQFISGAPLGSGTVITGELAIQIVDGIYKALPAKILSKRDLRVWCGSDFFRTYVLGLKEKNLYHYAPEHDDLDIKVPATNLILTGTHGLDGTNKLYALRTSNMHLGTDLEGEDETFSMKYAEEAEEVRFKSAFKLGVQIAFPDEVVEFHLG